MTQQQWTEYEYEVAKAMTTYPTLLCFDAIGLFTFSLDDTPENSDGWVPKLEEVEDWSPRAIVRVDVCQVTALSEKLRRDWNRKFKFDMLVRIATSQTKMFPDQQTTIVNEGMLTEELVINEVRRILKSRKYHEYESRFLWGSKVVQLDPKGR